MRSIATAFMSPTEFDAFVADVSTDERLGPVDGVSLVVIDGVEPPRASPGSLPVVVAWMSDRLGGTGPAAADLVLGSDDVARVTTVVDANPLAATSLVTLLRAVTSVPVDEALALESATYSMLQAGPEFAEWRAAHPAAPLSPESTPTVHTARRDGLLTIELDRRSRHNAITSRLRDELTAALAVAVVDDSVTQVVLRGAGSSFCSGGDLDEFGRRADPATAHRIRLARSPARLLHRVSPRLRVLLHGAALGGGLEMAAFAARVTAHPDTRLGLPETRLGLVPGAGGTVSIARRIGRQRTAALALGADTIGVDVALDWGLVDEIDASWSG